jgi:hypothetical protein
MVDVLFTLGNLFTLLIFQHKNIVKGDMTMKNDLLYSKMIALSDKLMTLAILYYRLHEYDLAVFYKNASCGYKEKALNLSME